MIKKLLIRKQFAGWRFLLSNHYLHVAMTATSGINDSMFGAL